MTAGLINRLLPDAVALSLHGIGEPHAGVDDDERPYWLSAVRLREVVADAIEITRERQLTLSLTFDDANFSDYSEALPLLLELGLTGRFFVPVGRIGKAHYLSAGHLREMARLGMAIGCHGIAHVRWTELPDRELEAETVGARAQLEDMLGTQVREAACPFGAIDARVYRQLKRAGFDRIYTSYIATTRLDGALVDRFSIVDSFDAAYDLAPRLGYGWRCLDVVRRRRRWNALSAEVAQ